MRRKHWLGMIFNVLQCAAITISACTYYSRYAKEMANQKDTYIRTVWQCVVFLLTLLFSVLWVVSRLVHLGGSLAFGAKAQGPLITTGCYSIVRNPIYVFGTTALCLFVVLIRKPVYLAPILLIIAPMQYLRAMRENVELSKKFGDSYAEYKRKVLI